MKTSLKFLVAAFAFAASSLAGFAQATPKLALVDVSKVYDGHWSLPEQQEKAKAIEAQVRDQMDAMIKEGQALAEKFNELQEQTGNTLLSEDKRKAAAQEAQKVAEDIRKKEEEVQGFNQNANAQYRQLIGSFRQSLVESITKAAIEVGKRKGATLVIDKSGLSAQGFPFIMYSDASFDITEDVIAEVNKSKPAGTPAAKPAASSSTAPAPATTAPAGSNAPAVVFPPVKK